MGSKKVSKPLYKQFISLRENVQQRGKIFKFKKQKWKTFITNVKRKLRRKKKLNDFTQHIVSRVSSWTLSYKKRYKNIEVEVKKLKLFYGALSEKNVKHIVKNTISKKAQAQHLALLKPLENRLDTVLYRSKFALSMKGAAQMILQSRVWVNNSIINSKAYKLTPGDTIQMDLSYWKTVKENIKQRAREIPPSHLSINYKTLQIVFGVFDSASLNFFYRLNLEKIMQSRYH